jgi:hypothetical protein
MHLDSLQYLQNAEIKFIQYSDCFSSNEDEQIQEQSFIENSSSSA